MGFEGFVGVDSDSGNCGAFQEGVVLRLSGGILLSKGVSECQGRLRFEQIATCVGQSLQHTQPHSYLSRITTVFPHMKGPRECILEVETYFANEETCAASCEQRQRLRLVCRIRSQLAN